MSAPVFHPRQPTVGRSDSIAYIEMEPDPTLKDYVHCFWHLQSRHVLEDSYDYRIVSDGCLDIIYDCKSGTGPFVMGFHDRYTVYDLGRSFHYGGIRFLPGAFPLLFDVSAAEMSNKFQALEKIIPKKAHHVQGDFLEWDSGSLSFSKIENQIAEYLTGQTLDSDRRFFDALEIIIRKSGKVLLEDLQTGLSPRQLRRLFKYYVGASPKAFCQVVRFQQILQSKPSHQSLSQNSLFYSNGYYDQAHFIKDFKKFYGVTPGVAFGKRQ